MEPAMTPKRERRTHPRAWFLLGQAHLAARLRTGSPLRVLNTSPEGMLVESPARLLPGRQVDLVLQCGPTRERTPWLVVHSRVGCLRGTSEIRFRAGLRRAQGTNYSPQITPETCRNVLPAAVVAERSAQAFSADNAQCRVDGTEFGRPDQP